MTNFLNEVRFGEVFHIASHRCEVHRSVSTCSNM